MSLAINEHSDDVDSAEESDDDELEDSDGGSDDADEESDTDADKKKQPEEGVAEPKTKAERLRESLLQQYQERQGKQLYIRFPHKLPGEQKEFEQKVQSLSPLIVKAHKPRQKHARFCLVDFNSKDDRNAALKSIKAAAKANPDYEVFASIPRTENEEFVKELAARKLRTLENKKAKARLRRAGKLALERETFTSTIVVLNLPKSSSTSEVRKLFPKAIDVQIKAARGRMNGASVAAITLPSTQEARAALKQTYSLGGTTLLMRFDTRKPKKRPEETKTGKSKSKVTPDKLADEDATPSTKRPKIERKKFTSAPVASVKPQKLKAKKQIKKIVHKK